MVKLSGRARTWHRLACRHAADLFDCDVPPGAFGIDGPWHSVAARFADGREEDVTFTFVQDGWASWRDNDENNTYPQQVPANQSARARRARAFWASPDCLGEDPAADAEYEAALAAELAEMERASAATLPCKVAALC